MDNPGRATTVPEPSTTGLSVLVDPEKPDVE